MVPSLRCTARALACAALASAACASASCGTSSSRAPSDTDVDAVGPGGGDATALPPQDARVDASAEAGVAPAADTLAANRDRLLGTYLAYLKATPGPAQSNGLLGSALADTCDLWRKLAPSPQGAYLTLTARLQGSKVRADGKSMLFHVTKVYRVVGGEGATATDPGTCGGGEFNRLILSMDSQLHDSLVAANTKKGASDASGKPDILDVPTGTFWRDSHDVGGPHSPFDLSDETDTGAPRGQTQFFKDPASALAKGPLNRQDLTTLVDPYAIEIDQDYDCVHNSNPLCSYTTYTALCFPGAPTIGTDLYTKRYGVLDPTWQPVDCTGK